MRPASLLLMPKHLVVTLDVNSMQPMRQLLVELNGLLDYLTADLVDPPSTEPPNTDEAARRLNNAMVRYIAAMDEATGDTDD